MNKTTHKSLEVIPFARKFLLGSFIIAAISLGSIEFLISFIKPNWAPAYSLSADNIAFLLQLQPYLHTGWIMALMLAGGLFVIELVIGNSGSVLDPDQLIIILKFAWISLLPFAIALFVAKKTFSGSYSEIEAGFFSVAICIYMLIQSGWAICYLTLNLSKYLELKQIEVEELAEAKS